MCKGSYTCDMDQLPEEPTFRWKWLVIVPAIFLMGVLGYRWVFPAFTPPVQPVPNGYNDLIRLGPRLARRSGFYNEMAASELARIVATNEPILAEARQALRKECVVALDWSADRNWFDNVHMKEIGGLRELARAFAAEGRMALLDGDPRRAVTCGLDALQLVPAVSHGGLGIDYLMGLGICYGGVAFLRDASESATLEDCQYVLKNLPNIRDVMDPPAELSLRERYFMRQINGAYLTFVTDQMFSNNRTEFEEQLKESLRIGGARTEMLRLHYAIRAFRLVEERLPRTLEELEGRELKEIPKDPLGQGGFVYQPGKDRYILYSVGVNGIDDGGVDVERDRDKGDLFLEPQDLQDLPVPSIETVPAN
jgi:hypothetical protein